VLNTKVCIKSEAKRLVCDVVGFQNTECGDDYTPSTDNVFVNADDADETLFSALFSALSTVPISYYGMGGAVVAVVIITIILAVMMRKRGRSRGASNRIVLLLQLSN